MKTVLALALAAAGTVASFGSMAQSIPADQPLTRAEVKADLELWRRAGLDKLTGREATDMDSASYRQALSQYRQWRSGSEYRVELARQQATGHDASTGQ